MRQIFLQRMVQIAAMLGLLGYGLARAEIVPPAVALFAPEPAVSDEVLGNLRGGFEFNLNGVPLLLAFSIEKLSYIDGQLVASTYLNVMELLKGGTLASATTRPANTPASGSAAAAGSSQNAAASVGQEIRTAANRAETISDGKLKVDNQNGVTRIQNGSGNVFEIPHNLNTYLATVIQNSVNNQVIQNLTILNATLTTRGLAAAAELNAAISRGITGAVR